MDVRPNRVPNGTSGRALGVEWRDLDVVADVFVGVRNAALSRAEGRAVSDDALHRGVADENVSNFMRVCDYDFIMQFKSPSGLGAASADSRERTMRHQGVMPLGRGRDEQTGKDAVYVLVSRAHKNRDTQPFISDRTWSFLAGLLGHDHRGRLIVLLGVRHDVFERAINYLYYQVDISSTEPDEGEKPEPLSIDAQGDDPPEIAKARYWLRDALDRRASDVHFEPGDPMGRVRMRIDGELVEAMDAVPEAVHRQIVTWIKTQSNMDISEKRAPQDGRLQLSHELTAERGRHRVKLIDVRISTIPTVDGQKMVMRLLDPEGLQKLAARGLETTIWDEEQRTHFEDVLEMRDGIALVTGPTGCGKTTTLNAGLYHLLDIYKNRRNIVTIEDPVEYSVPGVNQVQVNTRAGLTFERALRSIVRQG